LPDGSGPLRNCWGYSTVSFFAPEDSYCVRPEDGEHVHEFRDMVKALHRANIAVILDVVLNHTNEGNHLGPTFNFKGFGKRSTTTSSKGTGSITRTTRGAATHSIATIRLW
jgi:isoamylase